MKVMMMMVMITIAMTTKGSLDDVSSGTVELASHFKKVDIGF